ncbi:MAG: NADH-quinone oxidoreductase subunit A [Azospira oryzae]|jgi:NADH-quinone oxidoreductase subunit A|nr:MAG: NADH-quinone oxidoreductase subunit A [Azospira oryzae]
MTNDYLSGWSEVLLFIIGGLLFVTSALLVSRFIRPHRPNAEKQTTYESGEEPQGVAWIQFNIRFYIIALIFLLFEVEIVFLFPWATIFADENLIRQTNGAWGWFSLTEMVIFIAILAIGLAYAWSNGHLDWVKPDPQPTDFKSPVPTDFYTKINEQYRRK